MSDPVAALLIAIVFFPILVASRWFKTLETDVWRAWLTPVAAGAVSGIALRFLGTNVFAIAITLTLAALYVRLTGEETEPSEGMLLGAATGDVAALVLILLRSSDCVDVAACILAGAVAGFGCTLAAIYVGKTTKQLVIDVITAVVALGAAELPHVASHFIRERDIAIAAAAIVPLLVIVTMLQQYRDIRAELSHESSLGFVEPEDVRSTAHPLLRLGSGGWHDRRAHREFVRLASRIALRKRQQRHRHDDVARLYQLEIIKLRMQIQEMSRINHAVREENRVISDQ
jgi:hypothetical protein